VSNIKIVEDVDDSEFGNHFFFQVDMKYEL